MRRVEPSESVREFEEMHDGRQADDQVLHSCSDSKSHFVGSLCRSQRKRITGSEQFIRIYTSGPCIAVIQDSLFAGRINTKLNYCRVERMRASTAILLRRFVKGLASSRIPIRHREISCQRSLPVMNRLHGRAVVKPTSTFQHET